MTTTDISPVPAAAPDVTGVLDAHRASEGRRRRYCRECGNPYPCLTVELLTGHK